MKWVTEGDVSLNASVFKCVQIMVEKETVYNYITDITEVLLLAHQQIEVLNQICWFFLFKIENLLRFFMKRSDIPHQFLTNTFQFLVVFLFWKSKPAALYHYTNIQNKKSPPKSAINWSSMRVFFCLKMLK